MSVPRSSARLQKKRQAAPNPDPQATPSHSQDPILPHILPPPRKKSRKEINKEYWERVKNDPNRQQLREKKKEYSRVYRKEASEEKKSQNA